MWTFTTDGFYSIVCKPGDAHLTVRARRAGDLDRLRQRWLPTLGPTILGKGTDYPARATCGRRELGDALLAMALDIDYPNFKSRLAETLGADHVAAAHRVWTALRGLEEPDADADQPPRGMRPAYGGVVVDVAGRQVLLREPQHHFGGYVWTYAKGRPLAGEDAWTCAQREIREELGCEVGAPRPIPGWFTGDTSATMFFLCVHARDVAAPEVDETASVRWVGWDEAEALIRLTTSRTGRARDLAVLQAARRLLQGGGR